MKVIENACATQAILSVLLNCTHPDIGLGHNLTEFKAFVSSFDPEVIAFITFMLNCYIFD